MYVHVESLWRILYWFLSITLPSDHETETIHTETRIMQEKCHWDMGKTENSTLGYAIIYQGFQSETEIFLFNSRSIISKPSIHKCNATGFAQVNIEVVFGRICPDWQDFWNDSSLHAALGTSKTPDLSCSSTGWEIGPTHALLFLMTTTQSSFATPLNTTNATALAGTKEPRPFGWPILAASSNWKSHTSSTDN